MQHNKEDATKQRSRVLVLSNKIVIVVGVDLKNKKQQQLFDSTRPDRVADKAKAYIFFCSTIIVLEINFSVRSWIKNHIKIVISTKDMRTKWFKRYRNKNLSRGIAPKCIVYESSFIPGPKPTTRVVGQLDILLHYILS